MAKEQEEKKLHPLGGHLGDLFKHVSDSIMTSPEAQVSFEPKKPLLTEFSNLTASATPANNSGSQMAASQFIAKPSDDTPVTPEAAAQKE